MANHPIAPIDATIARIRERLGTMSYQSEERVDINMMLDAFATMRAAVMPFATARMDDEGGKPLADWHVQHDSEGVSLTWDPEFENGATLTIGQFKRARAAYLGETS